MRSGKSFELWYIFVKMYRENRYIFTGTFRYSFGNGIVTKNLLVTENLSKNGKNLKNYGIIFDIFDL